MTNKIKILCYGKISEYDNRKKAIDFFRECQICSEGAEQERYTNILMDLIFTDSTFIYDDEDDYEYYIRAKNKRREKKC